MDAIAVSDATRPLGVTALRVFPIAYGCWRLAEGDVRQARIKIEATLDRMLGGRLTINIISSDLPGAPLPSGPRYQRTRECMQILRALLDGRAIRHKGEFYDLELDPPGVRPVSAQCPPFYFGGLSDDARTVAAEEADVFLMWPEPMPVLR
jgi:alkanesulfonate monooxygenase